MDATPFYGITAVDVNSAYACDNSGFEASSKPRQLWLYDKKTHIEEGSLISFRVTANKSFLDHKAGIANVGPDSYVTLPLEDQTTSKDSMLDSNAG